MKRLLISGLLAAVLIPGLFFMQPVRAATSANTPVDVLNTNNGPCNNPDAASQPAICGDNATTGPNPIFGPSGIVTIVVRILSLIVGFMAIVFIIIQAIKMSASGGDPKAVSSARSGLIYALIGLALATVAQVLVDFVLSRIT